MSKGPPVDYADVKKKGLAAAAKLFLERGYDAASINDIAAAANVGRSAMVRAVGSKEHILCALVDFVLGGQFHAAREMLAGVTDDPVLYYAAETTLQLYMAESDEAIRNLYAAAYSMAESSEQIRRAVSGELLGVVFRDYLPDGTAEDFYQLEIASGGIIRGYMTVPCTPAFPIEEKVRCFLEASLRVYRVPEEKIQQAIQFVKQFDYPAWARQTVEEMLAMLEASLE